MGTLRVKLCDAVIFEKSGNQGSIWLKQDLRLQGSGPRKVNFIADVLSCGERLRLPWLSVQFPCYSTSIKNSSCR